MDLTDRKSTSRYGCIPHRRQNSYTNLFPTGQIQCNLIPNSDAARFEFIDKEKDTKLMNYIVNPSNAFKNT